MRPTGEHGRPGKGIDVEPESIARALEKLVDPERVMYDPVRTANYSYDASFATRLQPRRPDVVVQPLTTRETAAVVRWCYEHDVPMYPRGAATAMTGGAVALNGGVVIDIKNLGGGVRHLPYAVSGTCITEKNSPNWRMALAKPS